MVPKRETWTVSLLIIVIWMFFHSISFSVSIYKYPEIKNLFFQKTVLSFFVNSLFTIGLFVIFKKKIYLVSRSRKLISFGLLLLSGASLVLMGTDILISSFTDGVGKLTLWTISMRMGNSIIRMLPFVMLFYSFKFSHDKMHEQRLRLESEHMVREAQMELLKYQLNPHFLFNALNTIMVLIDHHPREAREIITDLSDYLRYSLKRSNQSMVPMKEEYQSLLEYLRIQKKRFREKLTIQTVMSESAGDVEIPVFIIHPLIENAVKFGSSTSKDHLFISVNIDKTPRGVRIEIENSGHIPEKRNEEGTGTGLENTRQRIALLYGEKGNLELKERNGRVIATMVLEK